jgi:hypothetical protein
MYCCRHHDSEHIYIAVMIRVLRRSHVQFRGRLSSSPRTCKFNYFGNNVSRRTLFEVTHSFTQSHASTRTVLRYACFFPTYTKKNPQQIFHRKRLSHEFMTHTATHSFCLSALIRSSTLLNIRTLQLHFLFIPFILVYSSVVSFLCLSSSNFL